MRVFNRVWRHQKGLNRSGLVRISGSIVVGSSGAVTSYDSPGVSVELIAGKTGRYRIRLLDSDGTTYAAPAMNYSGTTVVAPFGFQDFSVSVVSAQTDSALTTDSAIHWAIRNYTPEQGYFELQFFRDVTSSTSETHTDTNVESGGKIFFAFSVKTSSVIP